MFMHDAKWYGLLKLEIVVNPPSSTEQAASICEISRRLHGILTNNKFHPCKLKMVHQVSDDDPDWKLEFCENIWVT